MRSLLIRAAAVVALLQGAAHGSFVLLARPTHGAAEPMVVRTMKAYVFNFSGAHRSYWELYVGYALLAAGTCFVEAALLWILAKLVDTDPERLRWLLGVLILANIGHAAFVLRFFFYVPLVPDLIIVALLISSFIAADQGRGGEPR